MPLKRNKNKNGDRNNIYTIPAVFYLLLSVQNDLLDLMVYGTITLLMSEPF